MLEELLILFVKFLVRRFSGGNRPTPGTAARWPLESPARRQAAVLQSRRAADAVTRLKAQKKDRAKRGAPPPVRTPSLPPSPPVPRAQVEATVSSRAIPSATLAASEIAIALRVKENVYAAVVLNELLDPPVSLREMK